VNGLRADQRQDHFATSGRLFIVLWTAVLVALVTVVVGANLRGRITGDSRPELVRILGVAELSIVPSGRPPRHRARPSVDPRHAPQLPDVP
jgi:hypothetical protein